VALRETLAALGCDPVEELVRIARLSGTPVNSKISIYTTLLSYVHSRRKPSDDSEFLEHEIVPMTDDEIFQAAQAVIARRNSKAKAGDPIQKDEEPNDEG
jgi:hypothetical protein